MRSLALAGLAVTAGCGRVSFDVADAGAAPHIAAELEAEAGVLVEDFHVATDTRAVGGEFLLDGNSMGLSGPGSATYSFTVPEAGTYYLWGRTLAPSSAVDSFFLQLDGGTDIYYEATDCSYTEQWTWVFVGFEFSCPGPGTIRPFPLTAGTHTLRLTSREGQSALDRLLIVDDPAFVPGN